MGANPNGPLSKLREFFWIVRFRGPWTVGPVGDVLDSSKILFKSSQVESFLHPFSRGLC